MSAKPRIRLRSRRSNVVRLAPERRCPVDLVEHARGHVQANPTHEGFFIVSWTPDGSYVHSFYVGEFLKPTLVSGLIAESARRALATRQEVEKVLNGD